MRVVRNIFETKSSRVIRVLSSNPGSKWTIRELASEARMSYGYVHAVVANLMQSGYLLRNQANRLELVDPIRLIKRWAAYHQFNTVNEMLPYYTFEREIDTLIGKFRDVATDYALTSLSGAWLVVPQVRPVVIEAYIHDTSQAEKLSRELQLKPIPREGNVRLIVPYDEGVFYQAQRIGAVQIVSNIQLYVDLYNYPARGEEASLPVLGLVEKAWNQVLISRAKASV
jgi:hypothetical protein